MSFTKMHRGVKGWYEYDLSCCPPMLADDRLRTEGEYGEVLTYTLLDAVDNVKWGPVVIRPTFIPLEDIPIGGTYYV